MPLRKPHRKSRRGCIECKRRHTKCDEHRPRCATCTRLVIPCTWPKPRTEATSSTRLSEGNTPGVISNFINISTSLQHYGTTPEHLAVGDLRLLHHFTTKTYTTIDTVVSQQHIWRDSVVQIGFRHPYLLRGVLAISALHLATLNPDLAVDFLVQASAQYNCALLDFRHTLQDVNDENCVAVFAFSCITVIHAFAVAQIHKPVNPIEDLVNCMRLVQGVGAILRPHWETLKATELGPLLENSPKGGIRGEVPEVLQLKSLVSLLPNYDEGATAVTCLHAIDLLHTVLIECEPRAENQPYMAFLFTWPALLSPEFFSSLSEHEPVSIIILAHFAAMLGQKGSCWWIACWNTYILRSVETILSTDLLKWLSWPKKIMGISDTDEI